MQIGLERCNYRINEYFDGLMRQISDRKQELQSALRQFETTRITPLHKQLSDVETILNGFKHCKSEVITQIIAHNSKNGNSNAYDSGDEEMKDFEERDRDIITNITHTLSKHKLFRTPKLSAIPCFDNNNPSKIAKYLQNITKSGEISERRLNERIFIRNEYNTEAMRQWECEKREKQRKALALLHDIIYIHCIVRHIFDECLKFDASIQVELHPKLPLVMDSLVTDSNEKYALASVIPMIGRDNGSIHGLEYCVLYRIIDLFKHYSAFAMDGSHALISQQKRELGYFVDWIIPKLISKGKDISCDNLWNEINTVHSEAMMDIFKALSFHASPKIFVLWFKFLLTNHYKTQSTHIQIDVLNELWFIEIEDVRQIITDEIVNIFHGDLNSLMEGIHSKHCKNWLQDIDDSIYKLILSQTFNFEEIKGSQIINELKSKELYANTPNVTMSSIK